MYGQDEGGNAKSEASNFFVPSSVSVIKAENMSRLGVVLKLCELSRDKGKISFDAVAQVSRNKTNYLSNF